MSFWKDILLPKEFDGEAQKKTAEQLEKSAKIRKKAQESFSRFDDAINELDVILKKRRKEIDDINSKMATGTD